MKLDIKKFDIKSIPDDATVVLCAARRSGKSYFMRNLMYEKRDFPLAIIISETEQANKFYQTFCPKKFLHYKYSRELIARILARQKKVVKQYKRDIKLYGSSRIDPRILIILDDISSDPQYNMHSEFKKLFVIGRHYHTSCYLCINSPKAITTTIRDNTDIIVMFKSNNYNMRKRLYESYSVFPTQQSFNQVLDMTTGDYKCLIINNAGSSTNLQDIVFWYKAIDPGAFHFGDKQFWADNESSDDDSDEDEDEFDQTKLVQKKNSNPFTVQLDEL